MVHTIIARDYSNVIVFHWQNNFKIKIQPFQSQAIDLLMVFIIHYLISLHKHTVMMFFSGVDSSIQESLPPLHRQSTTTTTPSSVVQTKFKLLEPLRTSRRILDEVLISGESWSEGDSSEWDDELQ